MSNEGFILKALGAGNQNSNCCCLGFSESHIGVAKKLEKDSWCCYLTNITNMMNQKLITLITGREIQDS
ncbi:CFC_HP_G0102240.mRNA.1.CDS.1 [Saccharomyces cerevisiae]|nr:CFC_HP_G0102240.mRNA.1.CDS.1 [Saccharomyces cerevisiae]CAI6903669.1 CFC_HP_G0102240.mRNA.1.CDS.1 [Saccharomyces cerevisiae]